MAQLRIKLSTSLKLRRTSRRAGFYAISIIYRVCKPIAKAPKTENKLFYMKQMQG